MEEETRQILDIVLFLKEHAEKMERNVEDMATKMENTATKQDITRIEKHILGHQNRMGAIDNRIDSEVFARNDLESRVRAVVPNLPQAAISA